jgi:hypothetical protein
VILSLIMMSASAVRGTRNSHSMSHESNDAESGITACERVAHTLSGALPAPRKRRAACLDRDDTSDEQVRALDRAIRWNTFLFAVSALWADIINSSMGMTSTWTQIPPSLLATMSEVHP